VPCLESSCDVRILVGSVGGAIRLADPGSIAGAVNTRRRCEVNSGTGAAAIPLSKLPESRREILDELKTRGSATIAYLAEKLQLTGEAVRQQLLQLQRDGWVEPQRATGETRKTGRPANAFRLTAAGDHLFPKQYDVLALTLIDAIASDLGDAALLAILERVTDARVAAFNEKLRDLPLAERVAMLSDLYTAGDPYVTVETTSDGFRLIERNCPYYNVAMARPALCSTSVNMMRRLLGVRVAREEQFQRGDGRCVFRVFAGDAAGAEPFVLESDAT
jgi:predicted ArsR family transcriptional regulator